VDFKPTLLKVLDLLRELGVFNREMMASLGHNLRNTS